MKRDNKLVTMLGENKILSTLVANYAGQLRDLCTGVSESYGNRLANGWVVPIVRDALTSFSPQSVEAATIDLEKVRGFSLESAVRSQLPRLKSNPVFSALIFLLGGLPEADIYAAGREADRMKDSLIYRAEAETKALGAIPATGDEISHVRQHFNSIKPWDRQGYETWLSQFESSMKSEFDYAVKLADFFAGKTRIWVVGGKIKSKANELLREKLNLSVEPDWQRLPADLRLVGTELLKAYSALEKGTMGLRYEQ